MLLYELTNNYNKVIQLMEDSDYDPQILLDTLESIEEPLQKKSENIVKLIQQLNNNDKLIKEEIDRLQEKRRSNKNNAERLKDYLKESLEILEDPRIKTPLFSIWVQNNPPSLNIYDEKKIDPAYFVPQPPKLDRRHMMDDLKNGLKVEGAELTQSRGVRFR